MTAWLDVFHARRHAAMEPTFWVAIALSALLHAAILSKWLPQIRFSSPDELKRRDISAPLVVNLIPPRIIAPSPPPAPLPAPRAKPRPPIAVAPAPAVAEAPGPAPVVAPASRPEFDDLASYIEARRRARAAPASPADRPWNPPADDDNTRAGRIVEQNLGSQERMTFGYDPDRSGGMFQIELMGYDYAEFTFIGWNKDIRRITKQLIEVRQGDNSDIRVAVIRRMIAIIREQVQEDFLWESQRKGYLTLSARPKDNKALEDFLMGEFFSGTGPAR
jgi:hypothetical protein